MLISESFFCFQLIVLLVSLASLTQV